MNLSITPHPDVNDIVALLLTNAKDILQDQLTGMYMHGSLANGGFDAYSDIDIIFTTQDKMSDEMFSALKVMHSEIAKLDSTWANQLEVAYIPQIAFDRFDSSILYPHLDRGSGEVLHKIAPESDWPILCHILRERGIVILGPDPKTLIDPVSSDSLRKAVAEGMPIWFSPIIANPSEMNSRGYQSFFVLSMCRMMYTLKHGEILSKPAATEWGLKNLDQRWHPLIERALVGRQNPNLEPDPEDIKETVEMMKYTLTQVKPTPHPDVNEILNLLLTNIKDILKNQFVGMYLFGSLVNGDFDQASDIDVLIVTDGEISNETFSVLQNMHAEIAKIDSPWAVQQEISYIPKNALRRFDPSNIQHPFLDRGENETLKVKAHANDWIIQRHVIRERGIVVDGPDPKTLIDPVARYEISQAVIDVLPLWVNPILADPTRIKGRGYQSFCVLSLCRMLFTIQNKDVLSKPAAAKWAIDTLDSRWKPLIERAIPGRHNPDMNADAEDINETLEMMRFTLEVSKQPTIFPDVNELLKLLLSNAKEILKDQFVGMYLYGSLSSGDFNPETSDIDFLFVTNDVLSDEIISQLEAMHNQTWATSLKRAGKLEGAYIPKDLIRKHNLNGAPCPTINEGKFYLDRPGSDWIIQRYVVREFGVVLEGPDPKTLIDPVSSDDIRESVMGVLNEWWFPMLDDPSWLRDHESRYRSFAVITMCRVVHALETGTIVSKPKAIQWAQAKLDTSWKPLIDKAVAVSLHEAEDVPLDGTLDFIRFVRKQTVTSKQVQ